MKHQVGSADNPCTDQHKFDTAYHQDFHWLKHHQQHLFRSHLHFDFTSVQFLSDLLHRQLLLELLLTIRIGLRFYHRLLALKARHNRVAARV